MGKITQQIDGKIQEMAVERESLKLRIARHDEEIQSLENIEQAIAILAEEYRREVDNAFEPETIKSNKELKSETIES